jgi:hypothetical protein
MTFRIPAFCELEMSFEEAKDTLTFHGDLLAGLKHVDDMWKSHCECPEYTSDTEFYENWIYEVNAYNVVVETMKPLFV